MLQIRHIAVVVREAFHHNANLRSDNIVIIEFREAKHGYIVAALIDGKTTLKRFIIHGGAFYLSAANPHYLF